MTKQDKDLEVEKVEPRVLKKARKSVSLTTCVLVALVVALGAFALGNRSDDILAKMNGKTTPSQLDLSSLQEVYKVLNKNFDGTLDTQKLIDGAKHGLVAAAGDPYTIYMTASEAKDFNNSLNGTFEGIGAELKNDGKLTVASVLDNSPAKKAGLQAGDIITKVNDEDSVDWVVDKAVTKIRGEKGTTVKLTIVRGQDTKEMTITRDQITDPSVKSEVTADNIGVMRISRFDDNTADLAKLAAQDFKSKGVKGVVVDLRGNGGGLRDAAVSIAGIWMNDKLVMTERTNGKVTETLKTDDDGAILAGVPTVVLIDGGSASASEILAGALKDNGVATLLGEKSFGKGSVQTVQPLDNGGVLKVTVARWYTPNGKNINKAGINPDVEVKISDADAKAGTDTQKNAAIEKLKAGL